MEANFPKNPSGEQSMEERLWDFIDGTLPAADRPFIEQLLETNLEWREKYKELLEVQDLLKGTELHSPSMRFTKNVMEEIAKLHIAPATKTYINKRIIWGLAFFFIALTIGFIIYGFGLIDWSAPGNTSTITDNINIPKFNFNKLFSNTWVNVFMMINVILGLFLLDNYFTQKRKEFRKEM